MNGLVSHTGGLAPARITVRAVGAFPLLLRAGSLRRLAAFFYQLGLRLTRGLLRGRGSGQQVHCVTVPQTKILLPGLRFFCCLVAQARERLGIRELAL